MEPLLLQKKFFYERKLNERKNRKSNDLWFFRTILLFQFRARHFKEYEVCCFVGIICITIH